MPQSEIWRPNISGHHASYRHDDLWHARRTDRNKRGVTAFDSIRRKDDVPEATILTERFDRALLDATHVHGGQVRKETTVL